MDVARTRFLCLWPETIVNSIQIAQNWCSVSRSLVSLSILRLGKLQGFLKNACINLHVHLGVFTCPTCVMHRISVGTCNDGQIDVPMLPIHVPAGRLLSWMAGSLCPVKGVRLGGDALCAHSCQDPISGRTVLMSYRLSLSRRRRAGAGLLARLQGLVLPCLETQLTFWEFDQVRSTRLIG